jgi:hypothetical protein
MRQGTSPRTHAAGSLRAAAPSPDGSPAARENPKPLTARCACGGGLVPQSHSAGTLRRRTPGLASVAQPLGGGRLRRQMARPRQMTLWRDAASPAATEASESQWIRVSGTRRCSTRPTIQLNRLGLACASATSFTAVQATRAATAAAHAPTASGGHPYWALGCEGGRGAPLLYYKTSAAAAVMW